MWHNNTTASQPANQPIENETYQQANFHTNMTNFISCRTLFNQILFDDEEDGLENYVVSERILLMQKYRWCLGFLIQISGLIVLECGLKIRILSKKLKKLK